MYILLTTPIFMLTFLQNPRDSSPFLVVWEARGRHVFSHISPIYQFAITNPNRDVMCEKVSHGVGVSLDIRPSTPNQAWVKQSVPLWWQLYHYISYSCSCSHV
jgi:hypothetical protein